MEIKGTLYDVSSGFSDQKGLPKLFSIPEPEQPDYVFDKAVFLYKRGVRYNPKESKWVNKFLEFYHHYSKADTSDIPRLKASFPNIYKAAYIKNRDNDERKFTIEAGIMANTSEREIADYVMLQPDVIEAYENCYFNVRDKLEHKGYVFGVILAPLTEFNTPIDQRDSIWKLIAYTGGWERFLEMFEYEASTELDRLVVKLGKSREGRKLLYAIHQEKIDFETIPYILERHSNADSALLDLMDKEERRPDEFIKIERKLQEYNLEPPVISEKHDKHEERLLPEGLGLIEVENEIS